MGARDGSAGDKRALGGRAWGGRAWSGRARLVGLGLAALASGAAAGDGDPLAAYRWRARVLVLSALDANDAGLRAQRAALGPAAAGVGARDLVVLEAVGDGPEARALRRRLGLPTAGFRAVLVGKDGGAKLVSEAPIPPRALFSTIDAMPMRRDEMRRDGMRRDELRPDASPAGRRP